MADLYVSGLTGALDTETIISNLLKIKQQPLTQLTQQKALTQAKVSSLTNLYSALNGMQSFFTNLNISSIFSTKKATSSNTSVLTATATSDTPNLTMSLTVNKLAQTEMRASTDGMSSLTDTFTSSGTITLKYWKDNSNFVTYDVNYSAGQTLQDLVNSINSAQNDIKASIYYTGTNYRLLLTESDASNSTKETDTATSSYVIEASGLPTELNSLETLQNAQNASLTIGSSTTPVTSASNTFSNIVTGLDITVKDIGSATVTISEDYSQIDSTLNSFVSNYNSIISLINSMTGKGAQFQGDSTITTIKTGMVRMLNPLINAGLINYSDTDGTISINSDALSSLKSSNPEKLNEILTTLKDSFTNQLNGWTGAINTYKKIGENQITNIDNKITNLQEYLVKYEEQLRKEYAQLESFINEMNQISSRLEDFMTSLSKMTSGGK
ncbi:flagellar filament capping protein FliD [Thermodesulfovibrio yellowstonii]|uniref:Flagellar hook-associated protein 2 n=1 Tax=Thermodesulfovibrio yellowstonii TaxID=28262 RepID=A0A9W6LKC4_9BACT|nr:MULTISPECIES: flagellar filament capping protein FliD [Thermodesulfovibrio]MDI6865174.1 flagellar filament capping protein FliD [Thermodesulfovibrio yellowstonii]GLI53103.1 flagellar hook-associated protein 2 [Thermodesulfovibrio islandicus]